MKHDFSKRSDEKELIDGETVPEKERLRNFRELDTFNRLTRINRLTLRKILPYLSDTQKEYHLVDLGCGGGQFLFDADDFANLHGIDIRLTGVDNNPVAIEYLEQRISGNSHMQAVNADYREFLQSNDRHIAVIHCSLFCHHLKDEEIVELILMARKLNALLVINDLHRNPWAYYGAKLLTRVFNGTGLAKNDGPVSVLRGFTKREITELAIKANACCFMYYPLPLFRFLMVIKPPKYGT